MTEWDEILRQAKSEVEDWIDRRKAGVRRAVWSSLRSNNHRRIRISTVALASGLTALVLVISFGIHIERSIAPKDSSIARLPASVTIRVMKTDHTVRVLAEGVEGPILLRKSRDPRSIKETPAIRVPRPIFNDHRPQGNIVFYRVEVVSPQS